MKKITITAFLLLMIQLIMQSQNAWINEIHYDNTSTDVDEIIEVVIENAGSYNLVDFQVDLYNGYNGTVYDTRTLDNYTVGTTSGNFTLYYLNYTNAGASIQNGAPDGMALSYQSTLITGQFLSYEGTFTATDGPANGITSTDIGVSESSSTPVGQSLQLTGNGTQYSDFTWIGPVTATPGNLNDGQTFGGAPLPEPSNYPTNFLATPNGTTITLTWTDATGAQLPSAYLIKASDQDNIQVPTDGIPEPDDTDLSDGAGAKNVLFGVETYSFTGLAPNTIYYFKIFSYTNSGANIDYKTDGTPPSGNTTTTTVILFENYDLSWGAWTRVSVVGDQEWDRDNTYGINGTPCARISGYSGGSNENDDWLISPPMNLDAYTNEVLTFYNAMNYTGPDMEVKISTDYDGGGDPYSATWTTLSYALSPGSWQWTLSGNIDLSTYSGTAVYLAFQYTSTSSESATWEVDDILITGDGDNPPDIVINEIMYNSPGDDEEWIELYNNTGSNVDMSGWYIQDDNPTHTPLTLPGGTAIGPDEYFTIAVVTSGNFPFTPDFDGTDQITWSLGNGGDEVNLYNLGEIQVDYVPYDDEAPWPTEPDGNGPTLSLIDPSYDNSLPASWQASIENGGTPGAINFPSWPDILILTPNGGEIWEQGSVHDIIWDNLNGYSGNIKIELVDYSSGVPNIQLLVYNLPSGNLSWSWTIFPNQTPGNDFKIRISDLSGDPFDESDDVFTIVEPYIVPEIVITEIMYNPPESGTDSIEFIELYNNSDQSVDLLGFEFTEGVDYVFPSMIVNPGEYIVVCADSTAFNNTFGLSANQWTDGALSNGGEDIILVDSNGVLVDSVYYDDQLPWDTLPDGYGPSLTFCNPNLDNALAENWSASTEFTAVNASGDTIWATPYEGCTFILPVPYFEAADTTVAVGDVAIFTDLSLGGPTAWEWTFEGGNPDTSTQQNPPPIAYDTQGTYDVTLTVTNEFGDSTLVRMNYIYVDYPPVADFEADQTQILAGGEVNFTDLSTGNPESWAWEFEGGAPNTFIQQNPPAILYNDQGIFDVTLTVTNEYGENTLIREDYIDVLPAGISELNDDHICIYPNPNTGTFTLSSSAIKGADLSVLSLIGKEIFHKKIESDISTISLPEAYKGIYMIRIVHRESGVKIIRKLIIK